MNEMKRLCGVDDYLGTGFWGYGINSISDGKESYKHHDVEVIKKISGLNKHHEDYRKLLVLVFKIEGDFFYASRFSIDSCAVGVNAVLNTKYHLRNFENARSVSHQNKILIEFIFKDVENSISFQVDDYRFPQNLSGEQVAKYYIETIKKVANQKVLKSEPNSADFIKDFLEGIHKLQKSAKEKAFITALKVDKKRDEASFQDWFADWFYAKKYITEVEPPKGDGRLDLRISHSTIGDKIIEFKGWWNRDKNDIVTQINNYLTDFEKDAYVFMINRNKSPILNAYRKIITRPETGYKKDSWIQIQFLNSDYYYFKTEHKVGSRLKTLYHFIFSVYPNGI